MTETKSFAGIFTPRGSDLLVRPNEAPVWSRYLILPENARRARAKDGVIVRTGPVCSDPSLVPGLHVVYGPFDGRDLFCQNEALRLIPQESVRASYSPKSIAATLFPIGSRLLVRLDEAAKQIGSIELPENFVDERPQSGVILRTGELCSPCYEPGVRVIFHRSSGDDVGMDGDTARIIPELSIISYLDGKVEEEYLSLAWKRHLRPPPGQLLVERAARPTRRGLIELPDGVRLTSRASEAVVVASDDPSYYAGDQDAGVLGDRIFLAGTVTRFIPLGPRGDVELWVVRPSEVSGRLADEPPEPVEVEDNPHLAALPELRREVRDTRAFEEGDTRAPR